MDSYSAPIMRLIEQFEQLPGIGHKTAQRLAFYILSLTEEQAGRFAESITDAKRLVRRCQSCQNFSQEDLCGICASDLRERSQICVVESPRDIAAIETAREYRGLYHVLHGVISPIDNIGPDDIKIKELITRLSDDISEVIIATNPDVEGETTAVYLSRLIKPMGIRVTRIAFGLPIGGDLEYADTVTLQRALEGRREL